MDDVYTHLIFPRLSSGQLLYIQAVNKNFRRLSRLVLSQRPIDVTFLEGLGLLHYYLYIDREIYWYYSKKIEEYPKHADQFWFKKTGTYHLGNKINEIKRHCPLFDCYINLDKYRHPLGYCWEGADYLLFETTNNDFMTIYRQFKQIKQSIFT